MSHPAIQPGYVAVITGAASGIGLAAAHRFGAAGMKVVLADLPGGALGEAAGQLIADGIDATAQATDVSDRAQIMRLKQAADALGRVAVLMCNAGREGSGGLAAGPERWQQPLDTNLWGAIHCLQVFLEVPFDTTLIDTSLTYTFRAN